MSIPVLEGRAFTDQDHDQAPRTTIINDTMARRFWPGQQPIGKHIALDVETMRFFADRPPEFDLPAGMREIVGVVRDVKHQGLETESQPEMYIPEAQRPELEMTLVIRAPVDQAALAVAVRSAVVAIDPDQPVAGIKPMSQLLGDSMAKQRFNYILLTIFAAVALILSAMGVYGVMAYTVAQRTSEMGIRIAMGARAGDVLRLVLVQGMKPVLVGLGLGLAGAAALTRLMDRLLFGVSTTDPLTFAGVAVLLSVVAVLACYIPARRAAALDPMTALRYE